jgi:hypothetical protein
MGYAENPNVAWLLSRSYGQGGTVALPVSDSEYRNNSILGQFPAGVEELLGRLEQVANRWTEDQTTLEWCFLVGGPGNGKSEALKQLANIIHLRLPPRQTGEPASRCLPVNWPDETLYVNSGLEFVLINDASIPRRERSGLTSDRSLYLDLNDAVEKCTLGTPLTLFCNINKGILVEELSSLRRKNLQNNSTDEVFEALIEWLLNASQSPTSSQINVLVPANPQTQYYGQCSFQVSKWVIKVHAIFLDALSLLEPTPKRDGITINFSGQIPQVSEYRTFGTLGAKRSQREKTIAGDFLTQLTLFERWESGGCIAADGNLCQAASLCPFFQNTHWLRNISLARNFLDLLRAAEIAASRRFTYRDLLGHLSLSIIGTPREQWLSGTHPCSWVHDRVWAAQDSSTTNRKTSIAQLVNHRIYNNLFTSTNLSAWKLLKERPRDGDNLYRQVIEQTTLSQSTIRAQSFESAFNSIDPARDVDDWDGLREQVVDAVEALDIEPPSVRMLREGHLHQDAQSAIEELVDTFTAQEVFEELTPRYNSASISRAGAVRIKTLRKWRNTLLLRQVGLANGFMTFRQALIAWLQQQHSVLQPSSTQQHLWRGVESLLFHQSQANQILLAPFRPRTYTISRLNAPSKTLLVSVNHDTIHLRIVPRGDTLTAEILKSDHSSPHGNETVLAVLVIDLLIAREAILQSGNLVHSSFTEIGSSVFARVERVRASLISRKNLASASVFVTDDLGNLYQVVQNPVDSSTFDIFLVEMDR